MIDSSIEDIIYKVAFNKDGLVPVVVQSITSGEILMHAWQNKESLALTLADKEMVYWSRSRQKLWRKGATSGNTQKLIELHIDCDCDTLLAKVEQIGVACHTGAANCFFTRLV